MQDNQQKQGLLWNTYLPAVGKGIWDWATKGWSTPNQTLASGGLDPYGRPSSGGSATLPNPLSVPTAQAATTPLKITKPTNVTAGTTPPMPSSVPGSAAAAQAQQDADMQKYFPATYAINQAHSQLPQSATGNSNFNVSNSGVIPANYANGSTSMNDVLNTRNNMQNDMVNGTNPSLYPTTSNAAQTYYTQTLPEATKMSPEQQDAYTQLQSAQKRITDYTLQSKKQIADLYSSGTMTKDQADQAAQDIQREADARMAELQSSSANAGLTYNAFEIARQNTLAAVQAQAPYYAPTQVSPGNTMVAGGTGQQLYSGMGASPSTIANQAATFIAQDQATGNLQLAPDGTINQQYYQQKAQSYYSGQPQAGGNVPQPQQAGPSSQTGVAALPPNIANQPYVIPASSNSPAYINLGRVPVGQQQYVATTAGNAGIPVLSADDASNVQGIQYTIQALQPLETVMNNVLQPGITGRGVNVAKNIINNIFQNQPELVAFNQARGTAIKVIQSLVAGAGSGFRLTQPEIDTAVDNMPNATDNLETAQTKLSYVKSYLNNELNLKITGNSNNYTPPGTSGNTSVKTTAGTINTNW